MKESISNQQHNVLGRRLVKFSLWIGLGFIIVFTSIQIWLDYNNRFNSAQKAIQQIKQAQVMGIETALWNYSMPELDAQVEGLVHFPFINFAGVSENEKLISSAGESKGSGVFEENIPLTYTYENDDPPIQIGELVLQIDKQAIMSQALSQIARIFTFQALIVLTVLMFFVFLMEKQVTRHLRAVADYFQSMDIQNLNEPLRLQKTNLHDEIDTFVEEYNHTRQNLAAAYASQKESERKFATLLSNLPGIAFRKRNEPEWTMELISAGCLDLTGYQPDDLLNNARVCFRDLIDPADREMVWETIQEGLQKHQAYELTYRLINMEGHPRWILEKGVGIYNAEQEVIAIEGFVTDINQQKRQERELSVIAQVSFALRSASNEKEMLPVILDQMVRLLDAEGGALELFDSVHDESIIELTCGSFQKLQNLRFSPKFGERSNFVTQSKSFLQNVVDPQKNLFPEQVITSHSLAAAPMIAQGEFIGILWIGRGRSISENAVRSLSAIADIAANAIHRARLFDQTELRLQRLIGLRTIDLSINQDPDLPSKLKVLLEQSIKLLNVDLAHLCLIDLKNKNIELQAGIERTENGFKTAKLKFDTAALCNSLQPDKGSTQVKNLCARLNQEPWLAQLKTQGYKAYYLTPLIGKNEVNGIFQVFLKSPLTPDQDWLEFFETLAGQAIIAIGEDHLLRDLKRSNLELHQAYDETIEGWSNALDLRDKETEGHSQRVTHLTITLAKKLGVKDEDLVNIRRGALLHDIGKMGVPDNILMKPDRLSEGEWEIMRKHPVYALKLLSPIDYLHPALDIPYGHHEKWDGSGYPQGLSGKEIPLAARIFAVVDVFDALTSDRVYRSALSREYAISYIQEQSGKHFDPMIADLFVQMIQEEINNNIWAGRLNENTPP